MFKFTNLSEETQEEEFNIEEYHVSYDEFLAIRRDAQRSYVFDLRTPEEYEKAHLPGAHSLPVEHFENAIYQMPFEGDILLYATTQEDAEKAAEILYENGFDTFRYIGAFAGLIEHLKLANITLSNPAKEFIDQQLDNPEMIGVRIWVDPISAKKANFGALFVNKDGTSQSDYELMVEGIPIYATLESLLYLNGSQVSLNESTPQLEVENQQFEVPPLEGDVKERLQELLDQEINPQVAAHGGFVNLVDVQEGRVFLEFGGGCQGCGGVSVTLKQGVEVVLKENIPGITEILDITDHANGTNPYYQGNF